MGEPFDELKKTVADTLAASGVLQKIKAELRVGVFQALDESGQVPDKYYEKARSFRSKDKGELSLLLVRELLHHAGLNFTAEVFNVESALEHVTQPSTSMLADRLGLSSLERSSTPTEPLLLHLIKNAGHAAPSTAASAAAAAAPSIKPVSATVLRTASRAFSLRDKDNTNSLPQPDALQLLASFFPTASRTGVRDAGTVVGAPFDRPSARVTFEDFLAAFVELSRTHDADMADAGSITSEAAQMSAEQTQQSVGEGRSGTEPKREGGLRSTPVSSADQLFSKYFADSGDEGAEDATAKRKQQPQQTPETRAEERPQQKQQRKRSPPKEKGKGRSATSPPSASKSPTERSPTATTTTRKRGEASGAKGAAADANGRRKKDKSSSSSLLGDLPGLMPGAEPKRRSGRGAGLGSSLDDLFGSLDTTSPGKGKGDAAKTQEEEDEDEASSEGVSRAASSKSERKTPSANASHQGKVAAEAGSDSVSELLQRKPKHTAGSKPAAPATSASSGQAAETGDSYEDDFVGSDDSLAEEVAEEELSVGSESRGSHRSERSAGSASHRSGRSGAASRDDAQRLTEINARLAELEAKRRVGPEQRVSGGGGGDYDGGERSRGGDDLDILDQGRDSVGNDDDDDGEKTPVPRSGGGDEDVDFNYEQDFEEPSDISEDIVTEDISEHLSDLSISHGPDSQQSRGSAVTEDYSVGSHFSNKDFLVYHKP